MFSLDKAKEQEQIEEIAKVVFSLSQAKEVELISTEDLEVNEEAIKTFIDFAYGYAEADKFIAFRSFTESGHDGNQRVVHWVPNDENAYKTISSYAQQAVLERRSSYVIPALMPNNLAKASDACGQCVLVVDIDDGDVKAKLKFITEHVAVPSMVVQSGGITDTGQDKYHLYFKLDEEATEDELANIGKLQHRIAIQAHADVHFQSLHQPLRLPGSWHCKKEPRLVSIIEHNDREYTLEEIINAVMDMPSFDGKESVFDISKASAAKAPIDDVLTSQVHAGQEGEESRFTNISRTIGYWMSRVWEGRISVDKAWEEVTGYNIANVVPPWPEQRLRDEFNRIYGKRKVADGEHRVYVEKAEQNLLEGYSFGELYNDNSPMEPDLIDKVLGANAKMIIAGAPKTMKSFIWQNMAESGALGKQVLGQNSLRPLKIAYIQAEMNRDQLRNRVKMRKYNKDQIEQLSENLWISNKFRFSLDEDGIDLCIRSIRTRFPDGLDIIAFDPMVNLLPGDVNENDNGAMMSFLRDCVERVQLECDPTASIVLIHHSAKRKFEDLKEDPFGVIRGASALRGWYDQGIVIARKNAVDQDRVLFFENRSDRELQMKTLLLNPETGCFDEVNEDEHKPGDINYDIVSVEQVLIDCALNGEFHTISSFANTKAEVFTMSPTTLRRKLQDKLKNGDFKGFDGSYVGSSLRKGQFYLWVDGMIKEYKEVGINDGTGEREFEPVYMNYTHWYVDGAWLPKENNKHE